MEPSVKTNKWSKNFTIYAYNRVKNEQQFVGNWTSSNVPFVE